MTAAFCWTHNSERCSLSLSCFHGVVTIRTYSNPAEAAMEKSLLDSHDIFCRLADENVNLYGGGPLAMPIRLLVAEDQAKEAVRILETKGPELPENFDPVSSKRNRSRRKKLIGKFSRRYADFNTRTNGYFFSLSPF